ncbi:MAG TPA: MarR family winged helix-turn-helix transcriptional regulator [Burkholderiales bacterium]|nr:MarR family winged helix-turn-helix transcriptional regulator [Burkholderiales bacterium]
MALAKQRRMLEVLEQFRIIVRAIRSHYQNVERRAGISGAQLWALARIADSPGANVGALSRSLAIHQSTASNLLRQLQQLSLVERRRRGKDQRSVQIFVTGRGRALLRRSPQPFIGVLQQALTELPDANLASMHRQLARLIKSMAGKNLAARATPLSDL